MEFCLTKFKSILSVILLIAINHNNLKTGCDIQSISDLANLFAKNQQEIQNIVKKTKKQILQDIEYLEICDNQETIYVLDKLSKNFSIAHASIRVVSMLYPDLKLQNIAREQLNILEEFYNQKLSHNYNIYRKLKQAVVHESLKKTLADLIRKYEINGINLPNDQLKIVKKLILKTDILAKNFENELSYRSPLIELSKDEQNYLKDNIKQLIKDNKLELTDSIYAILQTNENENIRKKSWYAYSNKAANNKDRLKELIKSRHELAKMFNYKNFADYEIEDDMAKNSSNVRLFLNQLIPSVQKKFVQEFSKLTENLPSNLQIKNGKINPWDITYVQKKSLKDQLDFKYQEYFELDHTIDQMFAIFADFLGIKIKKIKNNFFWDDQIIAVEIFENNQSIGFIILDLFRRQNKYSSSFEISLVPSTKNCKGAALVVLNLPQKRLNEPYLLSHNNISTLFHEFGHAIHDILGKTELNIAAGTKVDKDYLEMPSQVFQELPNTPEIVKKLSYHYKTGQKLNDDQIKLILDFNKYGEGFKYLYQIYYALISLTLFANAETDPFEQDAKIFSQILSVINYFPNYSLTSFVHLTDYNSKYYVYLWSKVFAMDIMEKIKKNNFSKQIGKKFKEILLRPGGSQEPEILLRSFLKREFSIKPFLESLN